ncbi:MAG: hypothetical protein WA840_05625 [Caulobacteraceae bacterium]
MSPSRSFTKAEVGVLFVVALMMGVAIGVVIGDLPHPSLARRNTSEVMFILATTISVAFQIYSVNRAWKIRTSS